MPLLPPEFLLPPRSFRKRDDPVAVDAPLLIKQNLKIEIECRVHELQGKYVAPGLGKPESHEFFFKAANRYRAAFRKEPFDNPFHPVLLSPVHRKLHLTTCLERPVI